MLPIARSGAAGWTLVETLVVLGVIAVLLAILLPAVSGARQSARRIECLGNLRSIGQALTMERMQHDGLLPFADRYVDARFGELDPLPALAHHLDSPAPSLGRDAKVQTGPPWLCPSNPETGLRLGCSFAYTPADLMSLFPRPLAQRAVSAYLNSDPTVVVFVDDEPRHAVAQAGVPLSGRSVLRLDGGAEAGHAGLSVNPKK